MSTRPRLFGSIRLSNAEDVTECRTGRFQVQLRRLREKGRLTEKVQSEERRTAFDLRLHQRRRKRLIKPFEMPATLMNERLTS